MVRPTRSEAQDRNRRVLLDVARQAFLRDGYVATSVSAIATAAGFTTGIVYSAFGSKADLAMQVATELQEEQIATLGEHLAVSERHLLVQQAKTWARSAAESGWIRFELELLLDSIGDSRLAAAQVTRQQHAVAQIADIMRRLMPAGSLTDEATRGHRRDHRRLLDRYRDPPDDQPGRHPGTVRLHDRAVDHFPVRRVGRDGMMSSCTPGCWSRWRSSRPLL